MSAIPKPMATNDSAEFDPFAGVQIERVVPSTEAQREIWHACRLSEEASLAYNESISLHLAGELDADALQQALDDLRARHEALRCTLGPEGTTLVVGAEAALPLKHLDLRGLEAVAAEQAREHARRVAVEQPFDLRDGPLVRATLASAGASTHELILTAHHIVCDGWSLAVLAEELVWLYRARRDARSPGLDAAPAFGDHALSLASVEAQRERERDERYWVGLHDGAGRSVELPTDRPRPAGGRSFASRREDRIIDAELTQALRAIAARHGVSLFSALFGAFGALLARLTGSSDLTIGVPAAGQAAAGEPRLVGHCVNLLPVRLALDLEQGVEALFGVARSATLDAYEHQQCTFGGLLQKLRLGRDPGRLPLVSVLFNLDSPIDERALCDEHLRVSMRSNPRSYENFELFLNVSQIDAELVLECQYQTGLFDAVTIQRWLELFVAALRHLALEQPTRVVDALVPTALDLELLARFNASALEHDRNARIDTLISAQATATPQASAVIAGGRRLSYRDLMERADAVAAALQALGIRAGELVGISCSRSEHMLVALVGVLRAGAGYVPLDPSFPADRLEFMATDAALRVVATDAGVPGPWKFGTAQPLAVDALVPGVLPLPSAATADDVAYVIYTSGSTGRPKGVRVPHRSVVNLLVSLRHTPGMHARRRVLSVTTLSFDIAVSELIMPLTVGACVVIADARQGTDGERLRALIEDEEVDFIDATPSTWRLLLAAGWPGRADLLAICTGEPLPPELGRELLPLVGELWNGYGPTETTVWSSFHRVTAIDGPVPIGRPVANTRFDVVDAALRPLPVGAVGELLIAGEGVTLGYLARPELDAERFLPDPQGAPGARRYRTGDLGRWRNDGVLECIGRIDHQVKVRGYRIELGDIESNLLRHAQVQRALAVTREFGPGDVRLVAYLVPLDGAPDAAELRRHLGGLLPDYMIPQHFVLLDAIPLLPNGKIDRASLPAPELPRQAQPGGGARNELEAEVLGAMEAVLSLPGLAVDDDFFALGGHSLLAARLTAQLNRRFQLSLPMSTLFESPTAARLTQAVRAAQAAGEPERTPIRHQPDRRQAPLTLMQERIRFMQELHPSQVLYNTPSAHRLRGPMDVAAFGRALDAVVARQSTLRTWIGRADDGRTPVQRIEDALRVELPLQDLSALPAVVREDELMRRMQAIVDTPFDVGVAPLFRVALYRLAPEEHVFLFMPHHIVWDGWSFDLLYKEIAAIYGALVAGREPNLPTLPVSYGDYAEWHREWMGGPEAARQLAFWRARLQSAPALPALRARATGMSGEGAAEWIRIDKALTERLRAVAAAHGVTLNMLTLGAYAALVAQAWHSAVVAVGLPMRGRLMNEVDGVMGFFNNTLPIHVSVEPMQAFDDYLGGIRARLLEIFRHQDLPFEALAADPAIAQQLRRSGLYQVMFSFQDARGRQRDWGGLQQSSVLIVQKGATEDLGLWLMEVPSGLEGAFIYNAELFDATTVQAFRGCYLGLLERLALGLPDTVGQWCEATDLSALAPLQGQVRHAEASALGVAPAPVAWTAGSDEDELRRIWSAALGIEPDRIGAEHSLFDLGGTSLTAMSVVAAVSQRMGVDLPAVALIEMPTIPELARVLRQPHAMRSRVQLRPGGDRPPIFLVHDADGATLLYRNLAHRFDPAHPVFGLQPLVDVDGVPVHTRIEEMAAHYVEQMREVQPRGPYLVGGLCAGGVISFEIALQLRAAGEEVAMVALIDAADVVIYESSASLATQRLRRLQDAIAGTREQPLSRRIGNVTALLARKAQSYAAYKMQQRDRAQRTAINIEALRNSRDAGAAPPAQALSLRDVYNDAAGRYRQRAQLAGGVVLVRAQQGDGQQDDRPLVDLVDDPTFGWQRHVSVPIHCIDVAGGHSSLLQEPHVGEVGGALQQFVDAALARSGTRAVR